MRKVILIVLVIFLVLGGTACSVFSPNSSNSSSSSYSSKITKANYDLVEEGMTFDEVKRILGTDYKLSSSAGGSDVYKWQTSSTTILISIDTASNTVDAKTAVF